MERTVNDFEPKGGTLRPLVSPFHPSLLHAQAACIVEGVLNKPTRLSCSWTQQQTYRQPQRAAIITMVSGHTSPQIGTVYHRRSRTIITNHLPVEFPIALKMHWINRWSRSEKPIHPCAIINGTIAAHHSQMLSSLLFVLALCIQKRIACFGQA